MYTLLKDFLLLINNNKYVKILILYIHNKFHNMRNNNNIINRCNIIILFAKITYLSQNTV